jgi:uncharacterized repeat protein (TIGR01451 family)
VVTSTAVATTTTPDSNLANNTASGTTAISSLADVSVSLSVTANAAPGTTATATVTFTNNGPSAAANVTGTVVKPDGTTQTVAIGTLPAGSSTVSLVSYSVPASQTASSSLNWKAIVATTTAESSTANNSTTASGNTGTVTNASLSGRVWYDINRNRFFDGAPTDTPLPGFKVELLQGTTVVGSATTDVNGQYTISNQVPGTGYQIRFRDPQNNVIYGTPFNQAVATLNNNPSTGTNSLTASVSPNQSVTVAGYISNVTLYAGDNVVQQNLPLDPSGIVYDSVTRQPIVGATVKLVGPAGFNPAIHLIGGVDTQVTPVGGLYQYLFVNSPPSGVYTIQITPPTGYNSTPAVQGGVALPQGTFNVPGGITNIQAQGTPPAVGVNGVGPTGGAGTQYYLQFQFSFPGSGEVFNNHIPLDPLASGAILVNKTGNKTVAEVGDSLQYTIRMTNTTSQPVGSVTLHDLLPAGFRYIAQTARLNGNVLADPAGGVGPALTFNVGTIPANGVYNLTYFVRLGVGSQQGNGINSAQAFFPGVNGAPVGSNISRFKVTVQGGVFSNDGCIVGKVYMDCDGNFMQNNESGSVELGIPGVRLVMLDGSWVVTDNEGKYSICGIPSKTYVVKVDKKTLPKDARLVPSSNRNAGVGDSLFVDLKGGEMQRADFIEGSCSREVLEQVKTRRAQGGVSQPANDKIKPLVPAGPATGTTSLGSGGIR